MGKILQKKSTLLNKYKCTLEKKKIETKQTKNKNKQKKPTPSPLKQVGWHLAMPMLSLYGEQYECHTEKFVVTVELYNSSFFLNSEN